jgi:hypothetical protein
LGEITLLDLRKTLALAKTARSWAEAYQKKHPHHFNTSLAGMCGRASGALHSLLHSHDIPCELWSNHYHAFVVVDNRILVDITATQFSPVYPKVLMRKLKPSESYHWVKMYIHKNATAFAEFQTKAGWSKHQVVQASDIWACKSDSSQL